jgi:hypothetical protein
MFRNKELDFKYVGMIPSSLELNKLIDTGMKTRKNNMSDKLISDDIINVKFKQKVKSAEEIIAQVRRKTKKLKDEHFDYKQKLTDYIQLLKQEKNLPQWNDVSNEDLRQYLYVNGFFLTSVNKKTNKTKTIKYVVYKRSSAKSRVGECLFIKEKLYNEMIKWSQMGLNLNDAQIDVPSLLAYQALVGSSLDNTIKIKPENILIVNDVESKFERICSVVRKGDSGLLDSFEEEVTISNSLFDGESLLESEYFPEGKGMLLLRNHMFKSAAFNCKIQDYFKDRYKEQNSGSIDGYEEWQIPTMFKDEKKYAKDVRIIITPSSLKALKFSHVIGTEKDMFDYWKEFIKDEEGYSLFGVVKSEKKTKHGIDDYGKELQQTSYQMLNCLPMVHDDIHELSKYEIQYIEKLKNDDDFFIQHTQKSVNSINSNEMFIDLYKKNRDIVRTKSFRDFRKAEINRHVTHVKNGKIRLNGDYCTMLGNATEFLKHALGEFDVNKTEPTLKGNEIYTTLFEFDKELVGFRNPNTSPSNVLVAKNVKNKLIEDYFKLSDNIVCVNAIEFPLQDILSGSDYDSDTIALFDNSKLLELAKKCFGEYRVCINKVESSKKNYKLTEMDMSVIDNQLSMSQKNIGRVVNLGQFCMSRYWDLLSNGKNAIEISELLKKIDIMTVLSGICIDLAKKFYDIDIDKEVDHVANAKELKCDKPLFWKYVSQKKDIKTNMMNCPMDYLYEEMSDVKYADQRESLNMKELLVKYDIKDGDRKQEDKIINYVEQMCGKINQVYATAQDEDERNRLLDDINKYYEFYVGKLTVQPETMYAILLKISNSKVSTKLMNILHRTQKDTFLNAFNV